MKDRTVSLQRASVRGRCLCSWGTTVTLRYDPHAPPSRPLAIVHDGQPAGQATVLDAYANTTVKRDRPSWKAEPEDPAPQPSPSPLAMRRLRDQENT